MVRGRRWWRPAAGGLWVYPALVHIHVNPNPAIGALRQVAAEGREAEALLVFDDSLFAFRNLAVRLHWLQIRNIRVSETARWGLGLGGRPVWFLTEKGERDLPSTVSQLYLYECPSERVRTLSQERFLSVRLVRDPVLAWRGGSIQERDGTRRFMWLEPRSMLLLPPVRGGGSVTLAAEVHPALGEVNLVARVDGTEVSRRRLAAGRQLISVPIPELPERNLLNLLVPVELETDREVRLHGDFRPLALRVFRVSVEAPPYVPPAFAFFPEPDSLLAAVAASEGTYGAELLGESPATGVLDLGRGPVRAAGWSGPRGNRAVGSVSPSGTRRGAAGRFPSLSRYRNRIDVPGGTRPGGAGSRRQSDPGAVEHDVLAGGWRQARAGRGGEPYLVPSGRRRNEALIGSRRRSGPHLPGIQ